jgi:hypothetical protein
MEVNGCKKERQVAQEPNWKDKTQIGKAKSIVDQKFHV